MLLVDFDGDVVQVIFGFDVVCCGFYYLNGVQLCICGDQFV